MDTQRFLTFSLPFELAEIAVFYYEADDERTNFTHEVHFKNDLFLQIMDYDLQSVNYRYLMMLIFFTLHKKKTTH